MMKKYSVFLIFVLVFFLSFVAPSQQKESSVRGVFRNPRYLSPQGETVKKPPVNLIPNTPLKRTESLTIAFDYHSGPVCPQPILNPIYVTTGSTDYYVDLALQDITSGYAGSSYGNIITQYIGELKFQLGYTSIIQPPSGSNVISDNFLQTAFLTLPLVYIPVYLIPSSVGLAVDYQGTLCCDSTSMNCGYLGYHNFNSNNQPYIVICYGSASNMASIFSHELSETMTDTFLSAWYAVINNVGNEVADICEQDPTQAVVMNGNTYQLVQLWSNYDGSCVASTNFVPNSNTGNNMVIFTPQMTFNGTANPAPPSQPPSTTCTSIFFPLPTICAGNAIIHQDLRIMIWNLLCILILSVLLLFSNY